MKQNLFFSLLLGLLFSSCSVFGQEENTTSVSDSLPIANDVIGSQIDSVSLVNSGDLEERNTTIKAVQIRFFSDFQSNTESYDKNIFFISGGFSMITPKKIVLDFNVFRSNYRVNTSSISLEGKLRGLAYELSGINAMVGWTFEKLYPLSINLKAGVFGAYEKINEGRDKVNLLVNNLVVKDVDLPFKTKGYTFGFLASPELEVVLWKKISAIASYTQYYNPISKVFEWNNSFEIGLKMYIN